MIKKLRNYKILRAIDFVWDSAKAPTILSSVFIIVQGAIPLIPLFMMKLIIDSLSSAAGAVDKSAAYANVLFLIFILAGTVVISSIISTIGGFVKEWQSQLVTDHMTNIIHAKSIEVDLEYYENPRYYDTLHRAQHEAGFRPTKIVNGLIQTFRSIVSVSAICILLFSFHWVITMVILISAVPTVIIRFFYSKKIYKLHNKQTTNERYASYLSSMLTTSGHAKEIRLFGLGRLFIERFKNLRNELRKQYFKISRHRSVAELISQIFSSIAIYACFAFISYQAVLGVITIGTLVMYYQAFQRIQGFFSEILGGFTGLYDDSLFLNNLFQFLDLKRKVAEPSAGIAKKMPNKIEKGIIFSNVNFIYPNGDRKVLTDISFEIMPGEVIALVGENGSGKTTLIKLLSRLYDPDDGTILFGGENIRDFEIEILRREITIIFQDYIRYNLTARENIWLGNTRIPSDHKRVIDSALNSRAHKVIESLPKGYETVLGKLFEDGEELSIGEWQKVALARAFMRDSKIIILDEPTSSMDAKAEYAVFQNFKKLASGRTAILISHRFSTVRMADRIFVMDNGKIIEQGTHKELVYKAGMYAEMFETQAQHYR